MFKIILELAESVKTVHQLDPTQPGSGMFLRRRFGAGHFGAGHFGDGTIGRQNFFS